MNMSGWANHIEPTSGTRRHSYIASRPMESRQAARIHIVATMAAISFKPLEHNLNYIFFAPRKLELRSP